MPDGGIALACVGTPGSAARWLCMQYVETLARGIVAEVANSTANRPMVWVPLVDIAQRMKVPLSSVETGATAAVDWGWLKAGASLSEGVCLTEAGRALVRRVGL
jgi:hypothetical protein